jgi:hypothetical protein
VPPDIYLGTKAYNFLKITRQICIISCIPAPFYLFHGVLKSVEALFAGGELRDEDKDGVFRMIFELYFDAKKKGYLWF